MAVNLLDRITTPRLPAISRKDGPHAASTSRERSRALLARKSIECIAARSP